MNVSYQPSTNMTLMLYLDGEPWREVAVSIFGRHPKFPKFQSLEEFTQYETKKAYAYALRRMAAKYYFSSELQSLMKRKLVPSDIIQKVLEECTRLGYLDDHEWIQSFIRRSIAKNHGPKYIIQKLQGKGVDKESAEESVMKRLPPDLQKEKIETLLKTKYKNRNLAEPKERQKVIAGLARKGFSFEFILSHLKT